MNYLIYFYYALLSFITIGKKKIKFTRKKEKFFSRTILYKINTLYNFSIYYKNYIHFKQRYNIEIPVEASSHGTKYSLIKIGLKDLYRPTENKVVPLEQSEVYQTLLKNDDSIYCSFLKKHNISDSNLSYSVKRFRNLQKNILKEGYDPQKSVITINGNNILIDGVHRAAILLAQNHGKNKEIVVVQVKR